MQYDLQVVEVVPLKETSAGDQKAVPGLVPRTKHWFNRCSIFG